MTRADTPDSIAVVSTADDAYYHEARGWEVSRAAALERSERRAWLITAAAVIMALAALGALAALMPLKQAIPFLIYVDRVSGNTEVREAMDAHVQFSDILDKHWVMQYVIGRERYDWNLLQSDYDRTLIMSGSTPAREYQKLFDGPGAVQKTLGRTEEYVVSVLSVSLMPHAAGGPGVATVRFVKTLRSLETGVVIGAPNHYVATIGYGYNPSTFTAEKTLIANPLGFVVNTYRVDPELTEAIPHPISADQQTVPAIPTTLAGGKQ